MKNYLQVWYAPIYDPGNAEINGTIAETPDECATLAANLVSIYGPGYSAGDPEMWYFLMNKTRLVQILASVAFQISPHFSPDKMYFTQSDDSAEAFNSQDDTWGFDPNSERSVAANKAAAKIIKEHQQGRTQVPTAVLTDIRVEMAVAYTIARQQRNFSLASKILSIINQLDAGRITKAQAIKLYTALIAGA